MTTVLDSRAFTMPLLPNEEDACIACAEVISYNAKRRVRWVLCNVYENTKDGGRKWDRIERWHTRCYKEAGEPYGPAPYLKPRVAKKKEP